MRHIQIKTIHCPVCNSPNIVKCLSDQLIISAICSTCGEHIECDNTESLIETILEDL